jgi:hypothetical protein
MTHALLRALVLLLVLYGAAALLAFLMVERLLFQPPPPSYSAADFSVRFAPVGDGDSIALLHLPDPDAAFTLLLSHGNAEDLGHIAPLLDEIRRAGFGVIGYDYRGYGRSTPRRPTIRRAEADAAAAYRYAVEQAGVPPQRLIVHGRSVGSGPTLALAARLPVAAVVLESAFASPYRVLTRVGLLPFDRFPNLARVRALDRPLLVTHGDRDRVIPASHGRALFAAHRGPKRALWVDGAGHNDLLRVAGDRYGRALADFAAGL